MAVYASTSTLDAYASARGTVVDSHPATCALLGKGMRTEG